MAHDLAKKFDKLRDVQMRVGALPVFPHQCAEIQSHLVHRRPHQRILQSVRSDPRRPPQRSAGAGGDWKHFSLDGTEYEAFNTSGGLGTLCDTLEGKVENLNYKTVRYPGHRDIVKMLVRDLRLGLRRDILKDVLETAIPITYQDVVLIFVTVSGWRDGRLTQESYAKKIYAQTVGDRLMSAIQITTAAGICAMTDLLVEGKLPQKGFVRQEEAKLSDFLTNRFGRYYAKGLMIDMDHLPLPRGEREYEVDMRTGGQALIEALKIHGTTHAFCVPGESYLAVLDALYDAQRHDKAHHLPSGRRGRQHGGSFRQAHRQARHLFRHARAGRDECVHRRSHRVSGFHADDLVRRAGGAIHARPRGISGSRFQARCSRRSPNGRPKSAIANRIPEYVARAFHMATSGRPGPVVLSLPEDVLSGECPRPRRSHIKKAKPAPRARRSRACARC